MSNDPIATLVEADLSNPRRCFLFGTTTLGGSDACRPEMQEDGSISMRSLNLSHTVYRITPDEYRELRKYPKLKVGMWDFADENDQDAERIASAHRFPESAGRRIGDLERQVERLTRELADRNLRVSDLLIENEARNAAIYHLNRELAAEKECLEDLRAEVERHSNAANASRLYASQAKEALIECEEYFDNRADADCDQDGFIPNKEMRLLTTVREALKKAGA